jgi:hypothetical protein
MFLCENKAGNLLFSAASFESLFQFFWRIIAMKLQHQRHVKITKFVASVQEDFRDS